MNLYTGDPSTWNPANSPHAVAIGVFDGVHQGHRSVFQVLRDAAGSLPLVAMTFSDHPDGVVTGSPSPPALTTLDRRLELFDEAGVDGAAIIDFDADLMRLSPEEFVDRFLAEGLRASVVGVGDGFRFGSEASGTVDTLKVLGQARGFEIVSTPIVTIHGTEIRSSAIRAAVASGGVALASRMLGRPFEIEGTVVHGDGRGQTIGIPTANITMPLSLVRPARGVYAVRCVVDSTQFDGVCNVGTRPTFGGEDESIEVHLLDFDGDMYGKTIRVSFVDRIRSEERFGSVGELIAQIDVDIERATRLLQQ